VAAQDGAHDAHARPSGEGLDVSGNQGSQEPYGQVKTIASQIVISRDLAMDYGLIPDTRPPLPPPTRRTRLRWWWRDRQERLRERLACRIAPWLDSDGSHGSPVCARHLARVVREVVDNEGFAAEVVGLPDTTEKGSQDG
jgi:hypothetical protein